MSRVLDAISRRATLEPESIAISDGAGTITYGALPSLIASVASRLSACCPGDGAIAISADNSAAWVLVDLACIKLNRALVPLPPFFTPQQVEHAIRQTGASSLLTGRTGTSNGESLAIRGEAFAVQATGAPSMVLPPHTAKVTYTSGTTGTPKGVCLSQPALEDVSQSLVDVIGTEYAGTHLPVLPLGVLLENVAGLYTTLLAGGRYHVLSLAQIGFAKPFQPDFAALVSAIQRAEAKSLILVPELLRGLMQSMATRQVLLPHLKLVAVGGAKVSPHLLDMAERLHLPVYQGYGLSEAGSVVALNTPRANRSGSVGRVLPHVRMQVAPDGEFVLTNPGFLGYAGQTPPGEDYRTGDLGRIDDHGFVHINGRRSNVIITSFGRNVSPEWIESELLASPEIGQAFVFGEAKPALGALIVPSSMQITDSELTAAVERVNNRLPAYAQIRHWTKSLPFTPANGLATANGRLKRSEILQTHSALIEATQTGNGQHVSFFERLLKETEAERNYLMSTPQIRDGLQGRISLNTYRLYLAQAYHHVRHTVPLLEQVRDHLPESKTWLKQACEEYIAEESGHDEWILDDIRNAGGDADAVRHSLPAPSTEMMVAYAYDFISRINPVGFFGMVFVLEGTSTQLATAGAQALMNTLRLPPNCFRYLTSHGALDISHMQFFQGLMNRIHDPKDQADIIHMAKRMFVLFADVFRSIPHDMAVQHAA